MGTTSHHVVLPFLLLLVTMENVNVMLTRHSRNAAHENLYNIRNFVLTTEVAKFVLACIFEFTTTKGNLFRSISHHNFHSLDGVKVFIPAALYFVQNSLYYVALSNLSPATFQISYQTKILVTAIFSVVLLNRSYTPTHWLCLLTVTVGVIAVAISSQGDTATKARTEQHFLLGTIAVVTSATCSALAGVIFEKYLKQAPRPSYKSGNVQNDTPSTTNNNDDDVNALNEKGIDNYDAKPDPEYLLTPSLYMRNIQMAFFSILLATISHIAVTVRKKSIRDSSSPDFFHGFTMAVWILVILRAGNGLLVAAIVKMIDNVVKNLASACSLVLSIVLSCIFFQTQINGGFVVGSALVIVACQQFNMESQRVRKKAEQALSRQEPRPQDVEEGEAGEEKPLIRSHATI